MSPRHMLISGGIVACLAMQASTFVTGTRIWPFMAYCMYAQPRKPPPSTAKIDLWADLADGRREQITPQRIGLSFFSLNDHHIKPMRNGKTEPAAQLAQRIEARLGAPVWALVMEVHTYRILDDVLHHTQQNITFHFEGSDVRMTQEDLGDVP